MACPRRNKTHVIRKVIPWCDSCDKRVRTPVAHYKYQLKVTDNTTTVVIIVSGPYVEPFLDNVRIIKLMEINNINIKV